MVVGHEGHEARANGGEAAVPVLQLRIAPVLQIILRTAESSQLSPRILPNIL